jgi:hypothetical protein
LIARQRRRVRRKDKKTTETVYLISSLQLAELDALGWLKLKRQTPGDYKNEKTRPRSQPSCG